MHLKQPDWDGVSNPLKYVRWRIIKRREFGLIVKLRS